MVKGSDFHNRKVVILGLARQGLALARFFAQAGAHVTVSDMAPAEALAADITALNGLPVETAFGGHPFALLDECDLLCLSGGVPPQIPIVQEAIRRGIPLSNDSLLTMQLAPCPVIAITGSSGKTTTTTLVGEMLAHTFGANRQVHVGGNIGTPLIDRLDQVHPEDWIVLELSSFQLELWDAGLAWGDLRELGPDVAALLNITPNHLDRHPSMAAYTDAKLNLLRHLRPGSQVILGADDPVTARLALEDWSEAPGELPQTWQLDERLREAGQALKDQGVDVRRFSRLRPVDQGAWLEGDQLIYQGRLICRREDVRLRGDHNISNLLAAAAISGAAGADVDAMAKVARTFSGVPHRLEVVVSDGGVTWINDSIATAPERAVAGLRSFPPDAQTLILLAGGKDKNLPWDTFADEVLQRVNYLIGFGDAGPMIVNAVQERAAYRRQPAPSTAIVSRLEDAVHLAAQIAQPNTVVLLSPGGTSFDAYKNFEERGEHFRRLVREVMEQAQDRT